MFKKVVLLVSVVFFSVGILFASIFRTSFRAVANDELTTLEFNVTESSQFAPQATAFEKEKAVEYSLLWPGILPDHPLYPLKMLRDRVWLFLTTDSLKRAELLMNFADKRIWSSQMLVEKGKVALGVTTATKAEKYLEKALLQASIAEEKGKNTKSLYDRVWKATQKHEEILLQIEEKVPDSAKSVIEEALKYPREGKQAAKEKLKI